MKKLLIIAAIVAGILIPIFAQVREFYYLSILIVAALIFFSLKKRPLTLTDLLILFLITIPLHTFRFGGKEDFIRLSEIAFVPLCASWVVLRFINKSEEPLTIRKEFLLLLTYLFINIASTKNSIYPAISIKRIIILAYLFLFTYIVVDIVNKREKINLIIKSTIWISGISSIIAVLQSIFPKLIIFNKVPIGTFLGITFYRAGVGWHDPNYYAIYLGMNAALVLAYLLSFEKKYRSLKICFALQIMGLLVTFSRTVFVSLILVSLYILYRFGRKRVAITVIAVTIITLGIIATSAVTIYKKYPFLAKVVYRVADKEKLFQEPTLIMGHRYAAFKANWSMFLDHPILGVGPFMAMYNFKKYRPAGYEYPLEWLASHNQYLQLLAEKGIFGFIIFLSFIFIIIKNINKFIKGISDLECKTYLIGIKSAIFLYLISSLALETSHELQFWLTVGLAMALFNIIKKEQSDA